MVINNNDMVIELDRMGTEPYPVSIEENEPLDPTRVKLREIYIPNLDYVAAFNTSKIRCGDYNFYILRINLVGPQPGKPDITAFYGVVSATGDWDSYSIQPYSEVWNREELEKLIPDFLNLEDPRTLTLKDENGRDKDVDIGLTLVKKDGLPYPALATATPPFYRENFSVPREVEGIPPGKNTCPLDKDTFLYRKEGPEGDHTISVVKYTESEGRLIGKIVKEIEFPKDLSWAPDKVGNGGGFMTDEDENIIDVRQMKDRVNTVGRGLMVMHGVKRTVFETPKHSEPLSEEDAAWVENFEDARTALKYDEYEYYLGLAEFEWDKDEYGKPMFETLRLAAVSEDPLLTHPQMKAAYENTYGEDNTEELNNNKRVVYPCDGGEINGNLVRVVLTYKDKKAFETGLERSYVFGRPMAPVRLKGNPQVENNFLLQAA